MCRCGAAGMLWAHTTFGARAIADPGLLPQDVHTATVIEVLQSIRQSEMSPILSRIYQSEGGPEILDTLMKYLYVLYSFRDRHMHKLPFESCRFYSLKALAQSRPHLTAQSAGVASPL